MNFAELHYEKAPIVEAIIAIDVSPIVDGTAVARLNQVSENLHSSYPESESLSQVQFQFGVGIGSMPHQAAHHDNFYGRKYVSSDKRQLVVFRKDGFSFSRLPPYQRWETFRDEARRLWTIFRETAGGVQIARFGLRYVNRIEIPIAQPLTNFLKMYPEVPNNADGTPRTIDALYMRIEGIVKEIPAGRFIVQQASLPLASPNIVTLSLDFDISVLTGPNTDENYVWNNLETARVVKNQLFVESLAPDFLETFR